MTLSDYIERLNRRYKAGNATEHTFRADLQTLIESLAPGVMATNEPTRIACGAPDFIITNKNTPLGYIEAKDINMDLHSKTLKEQFDRYRNSLDNLIFTDYLDFHFYKNGVFVQSVRIGKTEGTKIVALTNKFDELTALLKDFCAFRGQNIKSSKTLAEMMAGKARMLANIIENSLLSDEANAADSTLKEQMQAFKDILIHDIKPKEFADIYAQTVAYGMFAARLHDASLDNFTRQEAAELIPKSNPFLRKLFGYIAGPDIDERIVWIVDALADIFRATNVAELLKNFGKATQQQDPIIHFYETFLASYDAKLRKARGVWYTPEPVVNFIVRAVDDILKTEFNLPDGLADRSKTKVKVKSFTKATADQRSKIKEQFVEQEIHKVQILDPAAGTGTFLAEVIKQVYNKFEGQQGLWSNYVEEHLVPRLNGFELLMASYAMAHLKLDLLLTETGYKPKKQNRLRVYLTNSLEEHHPDTGTLFANWLSTEANEANHIKRDTPVMVVLGNPPYSVSSNNKSDWIEKLMMDYKKDLNERNIQPLSDDYLKFIRFGQHFIEKNGEGVLAYISNNSFIDGVIHRQVRKNLIETFDTIYILDLHGSAKKNETATDGSRDENVFDIQQGVSINIFIKSSKKEKGSLTKVNHSDLYGLREEKYKALFEKNLKKIKWNKLTCQAPNYFLVKKEFEGSEFYEKGFKVDELFIINANGIKTQRDDASIAFAKDECKALYNDFTKLSIEELKANYGYIDVRDWKVSFAKEDLTKNAILANKLLYRPFDLRYMNYTGKTKGIMGYPRFNVMRHFLNKKNFGLILVSQPQAANLNFFDCIFLTNNIADTNMYRRGGPSVFPLYLYPEATSQTSIEEKQERIPNFNELIIDKIGKGLGLKWVADGPRAQSTFYPIDVLDYIYAVLYSPAYRFKYKEFLKIDFPRIPYPKDEKIFWQMVKLGRELRQLHLLESDLLNKAITKFPVDGDNEVVKLKYENKKVWINDTQYFDNLPEVAWEFYIGGYQPAQKWLKDRKGRTLNFEDIVHYQRIIVALVETDKLMKMIDIVGVE